MKKAFYVAVATIIICGNANAEITTKKQADAFMNQYCINLVNEFKALLDSANKDKTLNRLDAGMMKKMRFNEIVDTYSKLCK